MQRFKNILFVNDPAASAATALKRAVRIAGNNNAQLTIVTLAQELPRTMSSLQKIFIQLQEQDLLALSGKLVDKGGDIRTRVLMGTPFIEVIKAVINDGHDLVIKPAGGHGGVSSMLFGSTDLHLLRKCPCPVWIIKPSKRKKYARILAAVDPDPDKSANAELNTLILDLATSLAVREKSELHIVHAWSMPHESTLRSPRANLPKSEIDSMVRDTRKIHKLWLGELLEHYDLESIAAKVHLIKGRPSDVIASLAQKKRVELVVMGTVARTGIPGFFIGNTAEKTLTALDCSVLAVKPKAFTTPVRD